MNPPRPTSNLPSLVVNPLVQIESALQVELTRRAVNALSLTVVMTLLKSSLSDNSEKRLQEFLTIACPVLFITEKNDKNQTWQVRSVQCDENRILLLLQLAKKDRPRLDPAIIQAMKEAQTPPPVAAATPKKQEFIRKSTLDGLLSSCSQEKVQGSTVEERVRARALLKDERERQFQKEEKDHKSTNQKDEWFIIADILQTYATVRSSFHTTETCCMTLHDAVMRVQSQLSTLTKRQVVESLLNIRTVLPEWIVMEDKNLSKTASVWLTPRVYRSVRHRLIRDAKPFQPLFPTSAKSIVLPAGVESSPTKTSTVKEISLQAREQETTIAAQPSKDVTIKRSSPEPTDSLARKKQRTESAELRINPHLIWTDADYDGGQVISCLSSSPRALKQLFDQMKAGRRI